MNSTSDKRLLDVLNRVFATQLHCEEDTDHIVEQKLPFCLLWWTSVVDTPHMTPEIEDQIIVVQETILSQKKFCTVQACFYLRWP